MDAKSYSELILSVLSSCRYIEQRPHLPGRIEIPKINPNALLYTDRIPLHDNLCLTVHESAFFDEEGITERSFAYHLQKKDTNQMVWRICNHCVRQPIENPCHLHLNPDDEDERLEFFTDSQRTIFPYAMRCVRNHFEQAPQEWEESSDV